jgi:hypothetical protein
VTVDAERIARPYPLLDVLRYSERVRHTREVDDALRVSGYVAAMTENDKLRALPLAHRLRIAAIDLAVTGAPRALVDGVWLAVSGLDGRRHQYLSAASGG